MTEKFNPLDYNICFEKPRRLTDINSWHEHIPFAFFITQILKPKIFVELGTHKGDSYCAFCQAVDMLRLDTKCYAIDTWQGDEHSGFYEHDVLKELHDYHDPLYRRFSRLVQCSFDQGIEYFSDGSIDLLHIDGLHTYDAVKHDFENWLPKVGMRGVILLHDTNVREREFGVWKLWEELKNKYPSLEFIHGHGLGILFIGSDISDNMSILLDKHNMTIISEFFSSLGNNIIINHQSEKIIVQFGELKNVVYDRDINIAKLNDTLKDRDINIAKLNDTLKDRDINIAKLNDTLKDRDINIAKLNDTLKDRDINIAKLNDTLKDRDINIVKLNDTLKDRDINIVKLNDTLKDRDINIVKLNDTLKDRDIQIIEIDKEIRDMRQSIIWQLLMKYHNGFVERILPHSTRRRRYYDKGLKCGRILVNDGWRCLWWRFKEHENSKIVPYKSKIDLPKFDISNDTEKIKIIEKKISIVIPTKNAGRDFEFTLSKIMSQKGIKNIEIVIVDSGSTDGTLILGKKFGSKIYSIIPEEFNHGLTRNYGAEKTSGDYILFMVQDAIPIGEYWLYDMVNVLENDDKIVATTCRQVPRSDTDLFYCYMMWSHYKFINFDKDKITYIDKKNLKSLSETEKRRMAGIEDVCTCIRKDIFDRFKFNKMDYAEDIDLGIRLIENQYKLKFLHSVGVIHSHNRESDYILRRNYVNNKFLAKIFKRDHFVEGINIDTDIVLCEIISLYNQLSQSIYILSLSYEKDVDIDIFFAELKDLIKKVYQNKHNQYGDKCLDKLLLEFEKIYDKKSVVNNFLFENYFSRLNDVHNYLKNINQNYDISELTKMLYKLFATYCGWYLGDLYQFKYDDDKMLYIDTLLKGGV